MNALIEKFGLLPHPEGGYFKEVFDSEEEKEDRKLSGSIYFLLDKEDISHFHQIDCEEIWFYHQGKGLDVHIIELDGRYHIQRLDQDNPMVVLPKGAIFGAENIDKESFTFISCVTTPHFTYDGFKLISKEEIDTDDIPDYLFY